MLRMALFRIQPLHFGKTVLRSGVQPYASSVSRLRSFSTPAIVNDDRPLAGIKVVDLTRILAGPFATMMLVSILYSDSVPANELEMHANRAHA